MRHPDKPVSKAARQTRTAVAHNKAQLLPRQSALPQARSRRQLGARNGLYLWLQSSRSDGTQDRILFRSIAEWLPLFRGIDAVEPDPLCLAVIYYGNRVPVRNAHNAARERFASKGQLRANQDNQTDEHA